MANSISLGFGQLVRPNKIFEDVIWGFEMGICQYFLTFYRSNNSQLADTQSL